MPASCHDRPNVFNIMLMVLQVWFYGLRFTRSGRRRVLDLPGTAHLFVMRTSLIQDCASRRHRVASCFPWPV